MKSKNLLLFIAFLAVIFLAVLPYVRFIVQRQALDSDLARISLDYSTQGRQAFERRVDEICRKAGLEPGRFEFDVHEDSDRGTVDVEIRYDTEFRIFFFPRSEQVVLRNRFSTIGL